MTVLKFLFISLVLCSSFCSCSQNRFLQRNFKYDSSYFVGLQKLQDGQLQEAQRLFEQCAKKGSSICARKSFEEYIKIGNIRERVEKSLVFLEKYNDDQALVLASKCFFQAEEFSKIIFFTNSIDLKTCDNELAFLRLESLKKKNDSRYLPELRIWFLERPISTFHYKIFSALEEYDSFIKFRVEVYRRNYIAAFSSFSDESFLNFFTVETSSANSQILSDLGKTFLYSSGGTQNDFLIYARKFCDFSKKFVGRPEKFYADFYAARLFEKCGNYNQSALNSYKNAMQSASDFNENEKYDNALWYYLNLQLKSGIKKVLPLIKEYSKKWHSGEYFEDLFSTITPLLLSQGNYEDFYDLYTELEGYATDETISKFAYIYARLLQENIADCENKSELIEKSLKRALKTDEIYYKIMALYHLENFLKKEDALSNVEIVNIITDVPTKEFFTGTKDVETLLLGYAAFGFPEKIYPEFISFYSKKMYVSTDVAFKLSQFLYDCAQTKYEYFPQSIRIASRAISKQTRRLTINDFKLFFPCDYVDFVQFYSKEFEIPESNLYALIRSESFFDNQVVSSAGAIGLTQLMQSTASDMARKLKIKEYDLKDAKTNIMLGSYYLAELNRRLDGAWLPTFFAYNAGITRVRRWKKDSRLSIKTDGILPYDLLLEILPYEETRGYGRKLVSASAMYSFLYYGKSIQEAVSELVK